MKKILHALFCVGLVNLVQAATLPEQLLGLQQDVLSLQNQAGKLSLEVETLRSQYDAMQSKLALLEKLPPANQYVSQEAMRTQIDSLKKEYQQRADHDKQDILGQISKKIDKLVTDTPAPEKATSEAPITFDDNYPKEGIAYVVKPGDTLSKIAQDNHSTIRDIQNANKISNPKAMRVGQTLFVPQRSQ